MFLHRLLVGLVVGLLLLTVMLFRGSLRLQSAGVETSQSSRSEIASLRDEVSRLWDEVSRLPRSTPASDSSTPARSSDSNRDVSGRAGDAVMTTKQKMTDDVAQAIARKWDKAEETHKKGGGAWHQDPSVVKEFESRQAAGSSSFIEHVKQKFGTFEKCISIGCGDGGIEVSIVEAGLCKYIRGIDLSPVRVSRATKRVPERLASSIEFAVENAETQLHGQTFGVAFFFHSLHHIFDLEAMIEALSERIVKPNGYVIYQEYVGPVRYQFPESRRNLMFNFIKHQESTRPELQPVFRMCSLYTGTQFLNVDAKATEVDDPSETVRSSDIVPVMHTRFKLVEDIPLGGSFFQWIFHNCYKALGASDVGKAVVMDMLSYEMKLIKLGTIPSDYVEQIWMNTGLFVGRNSTTQDSGATKDAK